MNEDDFSKPFEERYLATAKAIADLDHWLIVVGMGGNSTFKRLQAEFIEHGSSTYKAMQSCAGAASNIAGQ